MRITKVELKNIKNYSDPPPFVFGPGIVAICGPNGSGKTTILEAIGWVLFDHLSYSRGNFVKNGEKRGEARVSFISKEDEREYEVFRDTAGAYNVYDPRLKMKIVEQKAMVSKWLRQHLGVEPGTDLPTLFRTTIGVPQGTFTVDFAETPAKRKPTFDKILKVEEYQRSAEMMKDVVKLIDKKLADIREQIASAEGELKRYDEVVLEKTQIESRLNQVTADLATSITERDSFQKNLAELEELKTQIEQLNNETSRLSFQLEQQEKQKITAALEFERAQTAAAVIRNTLAGHDAYLAARDKLNLLSAVRSARDQLRTELSKAETANVRCQGTLENYARQLAEIDLAKQEAENLAPIVKRQTELESERDDLQRQAGKRQSLADSLKEFDKELNRLRDRYAETSTQIEEAEKLKGSSELVSQLEVQISDAESRLSKNEMAWKTLLDKRAEFERVKAAIVRNIDEVSALEKRIASISEKAGLGDRLGEIEISFQKLTDETAMLSAEIAKDQKMLGEVKNGLCPLLSQRCLNMKDGQGLDQYFSFQLGDNQTRLSTLVEAKKSVEVELKVARAAAVESAQHENFNDQLVKRREELRFQEAHVAELESHLRDAGEVSEDSLDSQRSSVKTLKEQMSAARAAQSKYEKLEPLRQTLEEIKQEGQRRREHYDKQKAELAELDVSAGKLVEIEKQLAELHDPRGRVRQLEIVVKQADRLRNEQSVETEKQQKIVKEIADITIRLQTYSRLDEQWQETFASQAANTRDYQDYLANLALSETVEKRAKELEEAVNLIISLQNQHRESSEHLSQLSARYDSDRHAEYRIMLEQVRARIVRLEADHETLTKRLTIISAELDQLNLVKARVVEHLAKRAKLEDLGELSDFIRDCLKKAGPHITEAYLYTISISANQLYRDITGNALVNLKWDKEYEIILEEGGRERPFANLSGGEQMAAALAVRLALLKELSDLRIAFFDEPTTNMDEERRRNLAQQIGHIRDFDQLFVITHDDSFEGYTDEVINIGKHAVEAAQQEP